MKRKKHSGRMEWVVDLLLWVPELLLVPFRLLFWMVRGIGKVILHILDGI